MGSLPPALPAPQASPQHPAPQGLLVERQAIFLGQVFGRQGRPEAFLRAAGILRAYQLQNSFAESARLGTVGRPPAVAMLQTVGPFFPVPPPQTLGLPVAELQNLPGIH